MLNDLDVAVIKQLDPVAFAEKALRFHPDKIQSEILRNEEDRIILCCHRQFGKTTVTAVLALHHAAYNPGTLILVIAKAERQAQELLRKVRQMGIMVNDVSYVNESRTHLELSNGARVISLPSSSGGIRGYSAPDLVICDEASRIEEDVYVALRPMLLQGGKMIMLSTPAGKRGFFYQKYIEKNDWKKYTVTLDNNPRVTQETYEKEKKDWSDRGFAQEFLCEFLDLEGQVIGSDYIEKAFDSSVQPLFRQHGKEGHVPANILDEKIKPIM